MSHVRYAGPLAEIKHPRIIFWFLAGDESRVKYFRANSILALETDKLGLEGMDVR